MKTSNSWRRRVDRPKITRWLVLGLILVLGLGIRLYDLTDPPLDFHSTRQLWSSIIARGIYYQGLESAPTWQRTFAVDAWKAKPVIEPVIFESLVALTYRLARQEIIWIPRVYAAVFWVIGGVGLYGLARDLTSEAGGVISLLFYLFVPFGAIASRSFQPDPLMVMWIVLAWWAFYRWHRRPSWKTAILAGLAAGIAMLVKSVAVFMLLGGMAGLVLSHYGLRKALRNGQVWVIVALSTLPVLVYSLYGMAVLGMQSQFEGRFFPELLTDPSHYVRWASEMKSIVGFAGLLGGMIGIFLFHRLAERVFIIGLWVGYGLYGLFFPYHFISHNYYHLPLIPLVALCLAPLVDSVFERVNRLNLKWPGQLGIIAIIMVGVAWQMWDIRVTLAAEDFRHEPAYWQALAEKIGRDHPVVALTQDYGYRLSYYGWIQVTNWPETGHLAYRELRGGKPFVFEEWFQEETQGMDYFLVTRIKELDRQSELKETLYKNYAIADQGDGYMLFDLNQFLP